MNSRYLLTFVLMGLAATAGAADNDPLATLPRHIALNAQQDVSGQPSVESIMKLRSAGVTTVINLRPASETPDLDEKAVAEKAGLTYHSLPIAGAAGLTRENVARFDQLLKDSAGQHVLMHCASGNRVGAMMALRARWIEGKSEEEALAIGKASGMTHLTEAVKQRMEQESTGAPAPTR